MRVLYLNPYSQEVSGPDESLRTLLAALIPRGVEAHLVLPAPGPQVPRYQALGVTVHFAPLAVLRRDLSVGAALYPARLARATAAVAAIARRVDADLIHTNMEVLLEGAIAARLLRIPHVLHYRGNTLDRPKLAFDLLVALWTRGADHLYCISGATAEVFRKRGHHAGVEVLYNPVDVARFGAAATSADVRSALGGEPLAPLIGTVGRIHPRKDLETFVRAAALVAAEVPAARFVIVGAVEAPIEKAYLEQVSVLVRTLGLRDRVIFAGARRDVPAVMRALDVFVLTSRHEGFGRVVAEAMAAARPVVATDEGALPELLAGGTLGRLAAAEDPAGFARQIRGLLADRAAATALGVAAAVAAQQFDSQAIAARVWTRYRGLVDGVDRG
ncbi:MAG TPA: glycosyltransferase family 4 protein [Polyangia bacterium]|nr:glycosyltransferase family 4 protein [Polyangia bacterium]